LLVAESGGRVWRFQDGNGDHRADPPQLVAEGLGELRGIAAAADGSVLLSQRGQVSRLTDSDGDGVADVVTPIVRGLPDRVRANNAIVEGPDGLIYVSIGSTCNDCVEASRLSAAILQIDPISSEIRLYASGLRNVSDLTFSPDGALWATDQGSLSPCLSPDELNRILPGAHYGWPYCAPEGEGFGDAGPAALLLGTETGAAGIAWMDSPLFA
jgi:glucose/arabinose dehydrogenase